MKNALTVDLEYWYSAEFVRNYVPEEKQDLANETILPIIDLLEQYDVKATFFVLGQVAEKYPNLIKEIHNRGHEIASHGYSHKTLYELGIEGFSKEIKLSIDILKSITGKPPLGFRAPSFSVNVKTSWALEVLEHHGFRYDSSIFPIKTKLYGVPNAPTVPYFPDKNDLTKENSHRKIKEFPLSVFTCLKFKVPVAGGFYLRILPLKLLLHFYKEINKHERPLILYFHSWETYHKLPRVKLPPVNSFITYYGIKNTLSKIEEIISKFEFQPLREFI
jgi:polysaccharide deacetylase family protein (PEP-CTERM system associated)